MVAGGGGGVGGWNMTTNPPQQKGGDAGGLTGNTGTTDNTSSAIYYGYGGTQTSGGIATPHSSYIGTDGDGSLGKAGSCILSPQGNCSGGGGGYYGGSASTNWGGAGGGGSSFISGHAGSIAIVSASSLTPRTGTGGACCTDGTTDIECSKHYSGYVFTDTVMIDGAGYSWTTSKQGQVQMPNPNGGYYALGTGHTGNGYARITFIGQ